MPFGRVTLHAKPQRRGGITLLEGKIAKDTPVPFHLALVDLQRVSVNPMVNALGQDYAWGDATVRGYIKGDWDTWMKDYFDEVAAVFRRATPQRFVRQFAASLKEAQIQMVTDANGNLFWNLGHWIYLHGTLYQHYRERLHGKQTAFVQPLDTLPSIGAINLREGKSTDGIQYAVSGQRLIRGGEIVDLLSFDTETGRPLSAEFVGDFSHLVRLPFLPSLSRQIFEANVRILPGEVDLSVMSSHARIVFEQDIRNRLARTRRIRPLIERIIRGETISIEVEEAETEVLEALAKSDYSPDDYSFTGGTQTLRIAFKKSRFGHSLIGLDSERQTLFNLKVYTDFSRRGLTLEETAALLLQAAGNLGLEVADAILMSNGGDLRTGLVDETNSVALIENSVEGDDLLYRGKSEYGITSAFIFTERT